jgi:hypothetical protein
MTSSSKIPHIYSDYSEFVGASDWNAFVTLFKTPVVISTGRALTDSDYIVLVDTTAGDVTLTLPTNPNHGYIIKNVGSSGNDVILSSGETIEEDTITDGLSLNIIYNSTYKWVTV